MLFNSQRYDLTGDKHDLYFSGTAHHETEETMVLLTGVRASDESSKDIIANVDYITSEGQLRQQFNKTMSPADFERLINNMAMTVSAFSNGQWKLHEFHHKFKSLDDDAFNLSEKQKNIVLFSFLHSIHEGNGIKSSFAEAGHVIKEFTINA